MSPGAGFYAKPLFYSPEPAKSLDFVSVHFYPESGKVDSRRELRFFLDGLIGEHL